MKAMPNLMETELESFGASTIEDFTWKQLLDTERVHDVRPLHERLPGHATGKPLDPRDRPEDRRGHGGHGTPPVAADRRGARHHHRRRLGVRAGHRGGVGLHHVQGLRRDLLVNIEILDKILDMQRYLSLMESNFPTELGNAYRSMENSRTRGA